MSTLRKVNCKELKRKILIEEFDSANEVVRESNSREITDSSFKDARTRVDEDFTGVRNFDEALDYLKSGYQPSVDRIKESIKSNVQGQEKRVKFYNDVVGFQPIVPLALQNVPNCMVNERMVKMKSKVINVYYDMACRCGTECEDLLKAGEKILVAIMELEAQGYRVNVSAVQGYTDSNSADIICVKIKNANQPLDLKRMSFPLTHVAFFRCIGFDWYSRVPGGTYRDGYGRALGYSCSRKEMEKGFEEIFKKKCVVFRATDALRKDKEWLKEAMTNG